MVFYPREEDPHGIGAIVQEGDASPIQVIRQLVDVCLQLGKGWDGKSRAVLGNLGSAEGQ